jgi:hypothetical protein
MKKWRVKISSLSGDISPCPGGGGGIQTLKFLSSQYLCTEY